MDALASAETKSFKWYEIWRDVFLHPSDKTFVRILEDPAASPRRVYIWLAVVGLLSGLLKAISTLEISVLRQILTVISGPIIAIVGLALVAAFLHWNSKRFKGQGSYARMVYVLGAIYAPASLIMIILDVLWPLAGTIIALAQFAFGLFLVYITAQAIKAAETLETKKAYSSLILLVLLGLLFAVCSITVSALLGPAFGNID